MSNNKGISLIETLIAMVVLLLVFLALMQTALVSIDANAANLLRDEAISIAEATMNAARNVPFDSVVTLPAETVRKKIRALKDPSNPSLDFPFTVTRTVNNLSGDNRQITILVGWQWKGENYTHSITTIRKSND